jgi:hypothetical protein
MEAIHLNQKEQKCETHGNAVGKITNVKPVWKYLECWKVLGEKMKYLC